MYKNLMFLLSLKVIQNYKKELQELSKIIPNLDVNKLHSNIKSRNKYTWITRNQELQEQDLEIIKKMEDIFYESQIHRVYPNNELLSQAMGFVNMENEGLSGLELLYDKQLRGKPILKKYFKDAKGRPIKIESGKVDVGVEDLTLTIDKEIQASLEEHLKEGVLKANALRGGAAVMDAATGEILAIANYPTYDPNHYQKSNLVDRKLAFISDPFEPGSTLKTFTVAQALEHDVVTQTQTIFVNMVDLKLVKIL
jgi:cell division protein FtsI (penicillin-binding protein 3)